jgi:hypothetical protein
MREAEASALMKLKPRQVAELAWQIPCSRCEAMPEGPVFRDGIETIEFRCPFRTCDQQKPTGVSINLNLNLVDEGLSRFGGSISTMVQQALAHLPLESENGLDDDEDPAKMRPFCARLTPTQYYLYGGLGIPRLSRIANAGLRRILER